MGYNELDQMIPISQSSKDLFDSLNLEANSPDSETEDELDGYMSEKPFHLV